MPVRRPSVVRSFTFMPFFLLTAFTSVVVSTAFETILKQFSLYVENDEIERFYNRVRYNLNLDKVAAGTEGVSVPPPGFSGGVDEVSFVHVN